MVQVSYTELPSELLTLQHGCKYSEVYIKSQMTHWNKLPGKWSQSLTGFKRSLANALTHEVLLVVLVARELDKLPSNSLTLWSQTFVASCPEEQTLYLLSLNVTISQFHLCYSQTQR